MECPSCCKECISFIREHKPNCKWVQKVESTLQVPFEYIIIAIAALILILLYVFMPKYVFANIFAFYPAFFLMINDMSKDEKKTEKWISFWTLYSFFVVVNDIFAHYIPAFYLIKVIAFNFFAFTDYITIIYDKVFPFLHESIASLKDLACSYCPCHKCETTEETPKMD